jgi:5'(3')-deoxyribonucleotidase
MIVCFDIDNIINDLTEKTIALYNARYGKNIQMSNITTYNFYDCLSKEDADGIIALFKEKELWDSLKPLPHTQETLKRLVKQGHRIFLATATDPINFEWKCEWLGRYFGFIPTDNIIRIMDKGLLRIDVMVDDHLSNLTSNICERVCLDYPWNQSKTKDYAYDIKRAYSWSDIENIINNIERKMKE